MQERGEIEEDWRPVEYKFKRGTSSFGPLPLDSPEMREVGK